MLDAREKARYAWHCRRGMLELDLMLHAFLDGMLDRLSVEELKLFDLLLNCTDPELFAWLMGHEESPLELKEIVDLVRNCN